MADSIPSVSSSSISEPEPIAAPWPNVSGSYGRQAKGVLCFSLGLLALAEWLWLFQPKALLIGLYVPHVVWVVSGVAISLLHPQRRVRFVLTMIWGLIGLGNSESIWSVPRGWLVPGETGAGRIRVISLNCNVGSSLAANEVVPFRPQLVFLQETPRAVSVRELARALWAENGSGIATPECSILAEGRLRELAVGPRSDWILAEWTDLEGHVWLVASLRLAPPCSRLDLWSHDGRAEHAEMALRRTESLRHLIAATKRSRNASQRLVIGGDFNMVAYDRTLTELTPLLKDAFVVGGCGYGDTVLNQFPFQRFDQIWVDRFISDIWCRSVRTEHSDHRMVICDLGGS